MNNTFLSDFIMITNFKTIAFIAVLVAILFGVNLMAKKKVKFSTRMIVSTIAGLILGVIIQLVAGLPSDPSEVQWINEVNKWYGLIGYGFMDLLKMLVVPLIFVSIIRVIINMKAGENLGKLTTRSIFTLLGTTAIAAIVGIIVGNLFKLGVSSNVVQSTSEIREITPVVDLVNASYKIITSLAMTVIKFMPYAVVALLANTIAGRGLAAIKEVVWFIVALFLSIIIVFIIH